MSRSQSVFSFHQNNTPRLRSIVRPRAPFPLQQLFFWLVSLTERSRTALSLVASLSARVSVSSLDPAFPISPLYFCGGSVTGRLGGDAVTSCSWARGPEAFPTSNERLTLHARRPCPLGFVPESSARAPANADSTVMCISCHPLTLNFLLCDQIKIASIASLTGLKPFAGRIPSLVLYTFSTRHIIVVFKITHCSRASPLA